MALGEANKALAAQRRRAEGLAQRLRRAQAHAQRVPTLEAKLVPCQAGFDELSVGVGWCRAIFSRAALTLKSHRMRTRLSFRALTHAASSDLKNTMSAIRRSRRCLRANRPHDRLQGNRRTWQQTARTTAAPSPLR